MKLWFRLVEDVAEDALQGSVGDHQIWWHATKCLQTSNVRVPSHQLDLGRLQIGADVGIEDSLQQIVFVVRGPRREELEHVEDQQVARIDYSSLRP